MQRALIRPCKFNNHVCVFNEISLSSPVIGRVDGQLPHAPFERQFSQLLCPFFHIQPVLSLISIVQPFFLANKISSVSLCDPDSGTQQSTGQTAAHCGSSWKPTHSKTLIGHNEIKSSLIGFLFCFYVYNGAIFQGEWRQWYFHLLIAHSTPPSYMALLGHSGSCPAIDTFCSVITAILK